MNGFIVNHWADAKYRPELSSTKDPNGLLRTFLQTWQLSNWSVSLAKGGKLVGHIKRDTSPLNFLIWQTKLSSFMSLLESYSKSLLERLIANLGELQCESRFKSWMVEKGAEDQEALRCQWDLEHEEHTSCYAILKGSLMAVWKEQRPPLGWQKLGLWELVKRMMIHLLTCLRGKRAASVSLTTKQVSWIFWVSACDAQLSPTHGSWRGLTCFQASL